MLTVLVICTKVVNGRKAKKGGSYVIEKVQKGGSI